MTIKSDLSKRLKRITFDLLVAAFLFGLFMVVWLPPGGAANSTGSNSSHAAMKSATATNLPSFQATPVIATIDGSISTTDSTFTGQRHFRSGIPGDTNCVPFGTNGVRFYDEFFFSNTSPTTQTVSIGFTSGCGGNTYMVANSPQFNPSNFCPSYLAGAGNSGNVNWDFKVCGNSQFSIVVYGLEPGVTCSSYTFSVFSTGAIVFIGPNSKAPTFAPPPAPVSNGPFALNDVRIKKHKHKKKAKLADKASDDKTEKRKHKKRLKKAMLAKSPITQAVGPMPPPGVILPTGGTTLAATVTDSIDLTEPSYTGPFPITGGGTCFPFGFPGPHFYDEYFFANRSSTTQVVTIAFMSACPGITFNVYSPRFLPNDVCANSIRYFLSGSVVTFTICPNTQFSVMVVSFDPTPCSAYSFSVFGTTPNSINYLGRVANLSITKTGPSGPITPGSDLTYLLTTTNNGPHPADEVFITDVLPAGTTFVSLNLLSDPGTVLPAPVCTTPPARVGGTVTCSLHLLPNSGTTNITPLVFALTVNVTRQASSPLSNTATVTHLGFDPNPANNSSTVSTIVGGGGGFNLCLQDEKNGTILKINLSTGDYEFRNCPKGITRTGRGTVRVEGCKIDFADRGPDPKRPDRNVIASINTCTKQGSASVQLFSPAQTFTIQDLDITNNTCACP